MRILIFLLLAWLVPQAAMAASAPIVAPIPEWVEPLPIPDANPALRDRHFQTLLVDNQTLFGAEQHEYFAEIAFLVQTAQGLQSAGNVSLPWQPDHSDLIVHKVQIRRGARVVDVLAGGQEFTILRRENNLESAMLDGTLTAVMQIEGMEVGDVLDVAFTVRRRGGALPLRGEGFYGLSYGNPVGHYHVRQIWPDGLPIRWVGRGQFEAARVRSGPLGTELVLDRSNLEGPQAPDSAPARFIFADTLQITEYRDWAEISRLLAPHYASASTLSDNSPLRAQIERIANASPDPRTRAMAALRLVQDDIRYFALTMGDGNYLPATADQTWTRRYGDCKGKTVTLIALLRGLGIEAEPVLVHSSMGDALPTRLPQMSLFNHVIVRARIDGQSYWLDGTRSGDRSLADLATSLFQQGLPLRENGAELETIPFAPPRQALAEQNVVYDASGGLDGPVPLNMEMIFRGDMAITMRLALAQVGRDEFLRLMREDESKLPGEDPEIVSVDVRDDAETGAFTLLLSGTTTMDWQRVPGAATHRFRFSNETIDWDADFERPESQRQDAPFALEVPVNILATETVILPNGGRGYRVEGESFERTVAASRIGRALRLEGGRAVARSMFVRLDRELPASQAQTSLDALREITDDEAFLIAPAGALAVAGASGPDADNEDATAEELVQSGFSKLDSGEFVEALADFDRAIALAPDWARTRGGRAAALIYLDRMAEAEASLAEAMGRDQADFVVQQIYGFLHLRANRPEDAVRSFTRALELEPTSIFARLRRAETYSRLGRLDEAMTDLDALLAEHPTHPDALVGKVRIHVLRNQAEPAIAAVDALVRSNPDNSAFLAFQAQTLRRLGRAEAASAAYDRAMAAVDAEAEDNEESRRGVIQRSALAAERGDPQRAIAMLGEALSTHPDDAWLLNERCWTRATAGIELEEALVDCDHAVALEPESAAILDSRAMVKLRLGRHEEAIADATAALAQSPLLAQSLYVRGVARLRSGNRADGEADLAAARRLFFDIDLKYREYGVAPDAAPARSADPVAAPESVEH